MGRARKKSKLSRLEIKKLREPTGKMFTIDKIKKKWTDKKTGEVQYLVSWLGYTKSYDTWEPPCSFAGTDVIKTFERERSIKLERERSRRQRNLVACKENTGTKLRELQKECAAPAGKYQYKKTRPRISRDLPLPQAEAVNKNQHILTKQVASTGVELPLKETSKYEPPEVASDDLLERNIKIEVNDYTPGLVIKIEKDDGNLEGSPYFPGHFTPSTFENFRNDVPSNVSSLSEVRKQDSDFLDHIPPPTFWNFRNEVPSGSFLPEVRKVDLDFPGHITPSTFQNSRNEVPGVSSLSEDRNVGSVDNDSGFLSPATISSDAELELRKEHHSWVPSDRNWNYDEFNQNEMCHFNMQEVFNSTVNEDPALPMLEAQSDNPVVMKADPNDCDEDMMPALGQPNYPPSPEHIHILTLPDIKARVLQHRSPELFGALRINQKLHLVGRWSSVEQSWSCFSLDLGTEWFPSLIIELFMSVPKYYYQPNIPGGCGILQDGQCRLWAPNFDIDSIYDVTVDPSGDFFLLELEEP